MVIAEQKTANSSQDVVDQFVANVGARVKSARDARMISRRELSEISGISERYLAQLETGASNISVALLFKIANALHKTPDWFLGNAHIDDDVFEHIQKYKSANPILKAQIQDLLDSNLRNSCKSERICLIGLRGAGKSTLGRKLAERLGFSFVELNRLIEEESGMPIAEIIALYGHEGYHLRENQLITQMHENSDKMVLAVGGSIVSERETYSRLLTGFHSIWLQASPEEHMQRVRDQGDYRPMAGNPNAMKELKSILAAREAEYAKADITVDTSNQSVEESAETVYASIHQLILQSSTQPD